MPQRHADFDHPGVTRRLEQPSDALVRRNVNVADETARASRRLQRTLKQNDTAIQAKSATHALRRLQESNRHCRMKQT